MTAQRNWRKYLTSHLINAWLADGRYRHLIELNGTDSPRNPEHRIAEDARVATDAPIDLVLSLFASILAIFTFFEILASVGGALTIEIDGLHMVIPSYLAIAE